MNDKNIWIRNWHMGIIILLLVLPLIDLLHTGLPITHDGQDHVARIANFYSNLQEGVIIPRWAGNLNWGYGHPILMFLYPLPSYFASLFRLFSFSFVDSLKLVFAMSFILSGLAMYLWMREVTDEQGGVLSAFLYTLAPYRFVDLYVRGAIGEHVAFIFPPLVLLSMRRLSQRYSPFAFILGVLSLAGLILAHNAISLMFLPIFIGYGGYLLYQSAGKRIWVGTLFVSIGIFGFLLSAFFWMPAFFEGKYTLRDIVTASDYATRFVAWKDFLWGAWSYGGTDLLSKQIGVVQWVGVVSALVCILIGRTSRIKVLGGLFLVLFVSSLYLMTSQSLPVWQHVSLLRKFQFPWRFLSVSVFCAAVLGGLVVWQVFPKKQWMWLLGVGLLFASTWNYAHAHAYMVKDEGFYTGIYNGTTDTGESSPIWSVRFMEMRPKAQLQTIVGSARITTQTRSVVSHSYHIMAKTKVRLQENTLYFPGWSISVDGKEVPIQFQDPQYRGIMTFWAEAGSHQVTVAFKDTKLRRLANSLSLSSLFILSGWLILGNRLWRRFR